MFRIRIDFSFGSYGSGSRFLPQCGSGSREPNRCGSKSCLGLPLHNNFNISLNIYFQTIQVKHFVPIFIASGSGLGFSRAEYLGESGNPRNRFLFIPLISGWCRRKFESTTWWTTAGERCTLPWLGDPSALYDCEIIKKYEVWKYCPARWIRSKLG